MIRVLVQLKLFNIELQKIIDIEDATLRQDYLDYLLETLLEIKKQINILSIRNFEKEIEKDV